MLPAHKPTVAPACTQAAGRQRLKVVAEARRMSSRATAAATLEARTMHAPDRAAVIFLDDMPETLRVMEASIALTDSKIETRQGVSASSWGPRDDMALRARMGSSAGASTSASRPAPMLRDGVNSDVLVPSTRVHRSQRQRSSVGLPDHRAAGRDVLPGRRGVRTASTSGALPSSSASEAESTAQLITLLSKQLRQELRSRRGEQATAVDLFLAGGSHKLLTPAQVSVLSRAVRAGAAVRAAASGVLEADGSADGSDSSAAKVAAVLAKAGLSSMAEYRRVLQEADEAAWLLEKYNLRLVVACAWKYRTRGLEMGDLLQEGLSGLRKAVHAYDPSRGTRFSTCAVMMIRQAVSRCVENHGRVVRVPPYVVARVNKIYRAAKELSAQVHRTRPPTIEELGDAVGIPAAKVHAALRAVREARSLDAPLSGARGDDPDSLVDLVAADDEVGEGGADAYGEAVDKLVREDLTGLLAALPPRMRAVLEYRYGLHKDCMDGRGLSLAEVAQKLQRSIETARVLEMQGLRRLQALGRMRGALRTHLYWGV